MFGIRSPLQRLVGKKRRRPAARAVARPPLARQSRRQFLESVVDTDRLVMTAHFPSPSIGHVRRHGMAFRFDYIEE